MHLRILLSFPASSAVPPTLQTMKMLVENYDWYIGYNDTELDFIISDNPAQMIWCHFNDICIPVSKHKSVVMRVKDEEAPMISGDKAKGNIINMSIKGVIAYNTMPPSGIHIHSARRQPP